MATGAPDFYLTALTRGFIVMTPQGPVITTEFGGTLWRLGLDGSLTPPQSAADYLDPHWALDDDGNIVPRSDLYPALASFWDVDVNGDLEPPA